ncbi:hypothetical protein FRC03_006082 [Tulasnella sp. 419]|nr:hypothetical protein FRC03_006082 [Tulasnella sp. 419]
MSSNNNNNNNNRNENRKQRVTGPRQQVLGQGPRSVPPAWRGPQPTMTRPPKRSEDGSKILVTGLPLDVSAKEVAELFVSTVGPVKEHWVVYDPTGKSKGVAFVHFARPADAGQARLKYNNKIVDQQKTIRVELIVDAAENVAPKLPPPPPPQPMSLIDRIAPAGAKKGPNPNQNNGPRQNHQNRALAIQQKRAEEVQAQAGQPQQQQQQQQIPNRPPGRAGHRMKKGPRRIQKQLAAEQIINGSGPARQHQRRRFKSAADLDKEMEEYTAAAPAVAAS